MDRIEYRKLTHSDHTAEWREYQTLVVLTAGACLLALVIALKNILNVPAEQAHQGSDPLRLYLRRSCDILSCRDKKEGRSDNQSSRPLDYRDRVDNYGHHCYVRHLIARTLQMPKRCSNTFGFHPVYGFIGDLRTMKVERPSGKITFRSLPGRLSDPFCISYRNGKYAGTNRRYSCDSNSPFQSSNRKNEITT